MAYDMDHALQHTEAAGWVFGVLDPSDAQAFEDHLQSCDQCQAAVAEFEPVARAFSQAAPAAEPPGDLGTRIIAALQSAALAAGQPEPGQVRATASRRWRLHWNSRLVAIVSAVAGAAVTAAAFIGANLSGLPALAATVSLHAVPGRTGSAQATVRQADGGWLIQLTAANLPKLGKGQFYECWYARQDARPGHPQLITAGTFVSGNGTVTMSSAADPAEFKIMQITIEQPGDAGQHGQVILQGTAQLS